MAAVDEIAIKLGINVGNFKAALADAGAGVKKFKKEGEAGGDGFTKSLSRARETIGAFKAALAGAGIVGILKGLTDAAVTFANEYKGAFDDSVAATLRLKESQQDIGSVIKNVTGRIGVELIGAMDKFGTAVGAMVYGVDAASDALLATDEAARKAFDAARAKPLTDALEKLAKLRRDTSLAEADGVERVNILTGEYVKLLEEQSRLKEGTLEHTKKTIEVETAGAALRKADADLQKKLAADLGKIADEEFKTAEKRRQDIALSAEKEAELFELRKKSAEEAAKQGKTDLNIITLQNQQILAQMEIAKLRAKLTESLTPAEQEMLAKLQEQSAEIQKQITQKQALLAASNNRSPVEEQLLEQLKAQAAAIETQIAGLEARSGVTSNFTEAESVFLRQLEQQAVAIASQIELLRTRAGTTQNLSPSEQKLLEQLQAQEKAYTVLIAKMKERAGTSQAQTDEEVKYLAALKESAATLAEQIAQMKIRSTAAAGLSESEARILAGWQAQKLALTEQIEELQRRANSSGGISEAEAEILATWQRENTVLDAQILSMTKRATATGGLAGEEAEVLLQFEAQQKALITQIAVMEQRKKATNDQKAADASRLATLQEGVKATEAQITAITKGTTAVVIQQQATEKMTKAEKERAETLELQSKARRLNVELTELEAKIQREGVNPATAAQLKLIQANIAETEKQLGQRAKITLGFKEDLELFTLQTKAAGTLTAQEKARLAVLEDQVKLKRIQIEIETLYGKLMNGTITPAEEKRLGELVKQQKVLETQIANKGAIAAATTNQQLPAEQAVTSEMERQLQIADELLAREKQIQASRQTSVTNVGSEQNLSDVQLRGLITKLGRDIEAIKASQFGLARATPEQIMLQLNLDAAKAELAKRAEFLRALQVFSAEKVETRFAPDEFARLSNLINPDLQKQGAQAPIATFEGLRKVFPEQFRDIRNPPPR
jgi:hypothetical protein